MERNSDFSVQEAMQLAQSPAGQQLIALLQKQNNQQLQQAVAAASSGDFQNARSALSALLDSPEAKALLRQLGG